jgi:hypothetical protein
MQSFSRRVFGGSPDSFRLTVEYGPATAHSYSHPHGHHYQLRQHPGQQVRLPVAAARVEFEWTSDDAESAVVERFAQRVSAAMEDLMEERVVVALLTEDIDHAASFPNNRVRLRLRTAKVAPVLRNLQFKRSSSSGVASESLLAALLAHVDVATAWKVKGDDGFGNFWSSCVEVAQWASLRNINLSSCGLSALPPAVGGITSLKILRVSHNKLAVLPPELRALTGLEVLSADHNQLAALPPELRFCSSLRELQLEGNKLTTPVLDMRALTGLQSLQVGGPGGGRGGGTCCSACCSSGGRQAHASDASGAGGRRAAPPPPRPGLQGRPRRPSRLPAAHTTPPRPPAAAVGQPAGVPAGAVALHAAAQPVPGQRAHPGGRGLHALGGGGQRHQLHEQVCGGG